MQVLADNGGFVLAEDGSRLLFLRRRILPTWVPFVLGIVAVIGLGNAVVLLVAGTPAAGAVLGVVGLACAGALKLALDRREAAKAEPLDPAQAIVVLDRASGSLFDGAGRALAPLDQVQVAKAMQATSSSKALKVTWPGGGTVVYRGDPFVLKGGGIDVPLAAIEARGIRTSR